MAAPATYELSGRNRVPADERTMYQLRAEQYLRMLTGIDAETVADWSVSYSQSGNGAGTAVYDAARPWLVDTGLLYRGCD